MWRTISYKGDDDEEEEEDSDGDGDDGDDDSGGDDTSAAAGKEGEVAMTERRVMDASIDNAPPPPPHAFLRAPSLAKTPPSSIPPEARNKTPTDSLSAGGRRRHGSFLATLIETDKNTSKNHTRDDKKEDVGDDRDEALSSDSEDDESRFNGSDGGGEDEGGARSNGRQRRDDLARSLAKRRRLVGSVEVMWRGKVQRVCFPMPRQAHTLTAKTKRTFLDKTRLGTTSKRLELLFGSTDLFIAEMNWVHKISEESKLYRWIGTHLDSLRTLMYSLVVLLNVNVLLSPPSLSKPFKSLFGPGNYAALQSNERVSLALTFVLGGINFAGYFVIMGYVALTTVPVMICETDKFIERQRRALEASEWTNIGAFKWWFVTLVFNVMFIFMHTTNFPEYTDQSTGLYVFLIFGINLPWTLSCVRNYVVVPQSPNQRRFMIAYDTIVTKPFLRNHLLLQFLSVQGFISSEYFTLMLFDILNNSQKLANVVQAICVHGDSLVLVFLLFLATTLSYASFGVEHFPGDFTTSYQGTTKTFKTVLSAFLFLFYNQQRGVLKGSLLPPEPKSDNWLPRIAFDTAYFVWVGIILFTTITALLVDALSKARTEAALREAEEHNVCFMCGLKRAHYNDCSDQVAADSPSFDEHCDEVHDPWAYVAYCAYLQRRKRQDCTGLEAYVKKLLANNSTAWVPSRTTFVLEEKASQQGQAVSSGNEVPAAAPSSDGGDTGGSGGGGGAGGASNGVPPPTPKSPHAGGANKSVPSSPSGV